MGIYDREYSRDDGGGGYSGPKSVCQWLIIANVVLFLIQLTTAFNIQRGIDGPVTEALELDVDRVLHGEVWRLLTYAFLHSSDIFHILMNMAGLWWFGRAVEDYYGPKEFLRFYLVSAVVGGLAFTGVEALRGAQHAVAVGASGAVVATMVLFALHYPNATVLFMFFIPMRVIVLVVLFVAMDAINLIGGDKSSNIAFAVHLGGAAFAFLYYRFHWRISNWWPSRMSMRPGRRFHPKLRVFREPSEDDTPVSEPEQLFEAEVDQVLAKVARYGKESLTERERQVLLRASEVYKQRRK